MSAYCFSNRKGVNLLLLGTKEKFNLQQVDVTIYALITYFKKLFEFWVKYSDIS